MSRYTELKKAMRCKGMELEELTGYTRQGLYFTFSKIDAGEEPPKRFKICINAAVDKKIQEEEQRHEARVQELKSLYIGNMGNVINFQRKVE